MFSSDPKYQGKNEEGCARVVSGSGPSPAILLTLLCSVLDSHTLFWNNLFFKSLARHQNCMKLTLKIDDLNDAPSVKAGIFTVNENFLGKKFINMDYEQY
jgi:hypothetical protein